MTKRLRLSDGLLKFLAIGLLLWGAAGVSAPGQGADKPSSLKTSEELIEEAFGAGRIDLETCLSQHVYARRSPQDLDPRFRAPGRRVRRCGTELANRILRHRQRLQPKAQRLLQGGINQHAFLPYDNLNQLVFYISPNGFFKVWYVTTGPDAPSLADNDGDGVPDYVERVAEAFDRSRQTEVATMGYRPPLPDGTRGGDSRFDVYISDIIKRDGALGEELRDDASGKTTSAYIFIDNDFRNSGFGAGTEQQRLELMQITVAHEYFHAIQDAYDALDQLTPLGDLNFWYYEASSSWMENQVYPELRKFYLERLDSWFFRPQVSLDFPPGPGSLGDHGNGSSIFNYYLSDKFRTPNVVREVWETLAPQGGQDLNNLQALDVVLRQRGGTFNQAFQEFLAWNYFTGPRSDGQHYRDGALYPEIFVDARANHRAYPARNSTPLPQPPDHLGSNYIVFNNTGVGTALEVNLDGQDGAQWVAQVLTVRNGSPPTIAVLPMTLDAANRGKVRIENWQTFNSAALIVGVATLSGSGFTYTYSADTLGGPVVARDSLTFNLRNGWTVVGIPFRLENDDPGAWFNTGGRVAAWNPLKSGTGGYDFYTGTGTVRLAAGNAYFVESSGNRAASITDQPIIDPAQPFRLPFPSANWMLVGNPYLKRLPWDVDKIFAAANGSQTPLRSLLGKISRSIEPHGWYWDAVQQQYVLVFDPRFIAGVKDSLEKGEGLFVRANVPNAEIVFNPPSASASSVLARASRVGDSQTWSVELKAQAAGARDGGALFGMSSLIRGSGLQIASPPQPASPAGRVMLQFINPSQGNHLAKVDVRPSSVNRAAWDLVLVTDRPDADVTLTWDNLGGAPKSARLYLVDSVTGKRQSMRTTSAYTFRSNPEGPTERHFRIELVMGGEGGVRVTHLQATPTPGGVSLSYGLNRDAEQVQVRFFSPTGKLLRTFASPGRAGLNVAFWDLKMASGARVARGIYFVELTVKDEEQHVARAARSIIVK